MNRTVRRGWSDERKRTHYGLNFSDYGAHIGRHFLGWGSDCPPPDETTEQDYRRSAEGGDYGQGADPVERGATANPEEHMAGKV